VLIWPRLRRRDRPDEAGNELFAVRLRLERAGEVRERVGGELLVEIERDRLRDHGLEAFDAAAAQLDLRFAHHAGALEAQRGRDGGDIVEHVRSDLGDRVGLEELDDGAPARPRDLLEARVVGEALLVAVEDAPDVLDHLRVPVDEEAGILEVDVDLVPRPPRRAALRVQILDGGPALIRGILSELVEDAEERAAPVLPLALLGGLLLRRGGAAREAVARAARERALAVEPLRFQ